MGQLEGKKATISDTGAIVLNPADPTVKPASPELAEFLKMLHDLDSESLAKVSPDHVTIKKVSDTDVQLTIQIPNKPIIGGRMKSLKRLKTLKATKKLKRTPLSHKKIHHKQHKNPAADEEEDICLTLVR